MPKSAPRRKRIRTARAEADPTAVPDSKTASGSSPAKTAAGAAAGDRSGSNKNGQSKKGSAGLEREKHLGPVLDKLSSDSADDRLWATAATSHILSGADSGTRRALQSKNIVGTLINLLNDDIHEIKAEACGALRNLAIEGGAEVCAEMYNKSIVTKLSPQISIVSLALNNFLNGIKPANEDEIRVRKVLWSWIEHLSTIFWCLAETSDKAFKAIVTIQPLSDLLFQILKHAVPIDGSSPASSSKIPANVALSAAQAVYVLTDVNVPSAPKFPLPRDVSKSAAYSNTLSMLLKSLRNLSSSFESSSSKSTGSSSSSSTSEQYQSLLVMFIGIYQNLTSQRSFGKSTAKANEEEQEQEFTRLTVRILASLIKSLDVEKDAQSAIQAYSSLPSSTPMDQGKNKNISTESVEVSPQRRTLDALESRWTRVRLALEILGELVAGVDGLLDPALLGEEEYEEWTGIQEVDDGMETEEHGADGAQSGSRSKVGNSANLQQKPLEISKDIRSLLSGLPAALLSLGKSSSISFTSPLTSSSSSTSTKQPAKAEENLISTQIDSPSTTSSQANVPSSSQKGTYVPALSEVFSFVHVRALECLNNLLITLARSGLSSQGDAPLNAEDEDEEDVVDLGGDDEELPPGMEEMLSDNSGTIEGASNADEEDGMDADHPEDEEADKVDSNGTTSNYLLGDLSTFQQVFEELFHTLVDYHERYQAAIQASQAASTKKMDSSFESLQLAVEASVGCIWAVLRLCGERLTVGQDEHRLLLSTLQVSLQQPKSFDIAIRCVGALGQLAIRQSVSNEENESIGKALLAQLDEKHLSQLNGSHIGEIDLCSQVLDTIFDVYGEETRSYDVIFGKLGFLPALEKVLLPFRKLTKAVDKRKYPETRTAADAALLNLPAFINYRKQVQKKA